MKVAIVGTGISGNVAAARLRDAHDITVFEAADRIGGHTNTVEVSENGATLAIDTGFIVYNDRTYPNFIRLLEELGQETQASEMSFSVRAAAAGLEYCGSTLDGLFAQRSNLLRPSFYRMIRDILRFNEQAPKARERFDSSITLGEYLGRNNYGPGFVDHYLVPMTAAIWSAEPVTVLDMPLAFLVRFFGNHGLLQLRDRPQWRVIKGGSRSYVEKLVAGHRDRIRLSSPVTSVRRFADRVIVESGDGRETFDAVFLACHSDQALAMLADPTPSEESVLGAIRYQPNEAVLHTDESLMPANRRAWAAWNYHVPAGPAERATLTYNMNILQGLSAERQYLVTLNDDRHIDPAKILRRVDYAHPVYSTDAVFAQARQAELNADRTFYCGAYWRNGFHEDGVVSALRAVQHFEEGLANAELHLRRAG